MTAKISFYGASRHCDNPNSSFETFLTSVKEKAADPRNIEVLVAIDPDDNLDYFKKLQATFNDFEFKVIVSRKRHGYTGLHLYYKELFQHIAPTSKMLCVYSDDCQITTDRFDEKLLKIDQKHKDNIYIIHTMQTNRENYLHDLPNNLLLLHWVQQAKSPASYFPIISRRILDISHEFAKIHDTKSEWCPFANAWIIDCYIDTLSIYMKKQRANRIEHISEFIKLNPNQITANHHRPPHEFGLSPNNIGFIKMLSTETQDYLFNLATTITQHCDKLRSPIAILIERKQTGTKRILRKIYYLSKMKIKHRLLAIIKN